MRNLLICLSIYLMLAVGGCGGKPPVPTAEARVGSIEETFVEPARTRLEIKNQISMPVTGDVARVELKPGDRVTKGQSLVLVDRVPFEAAAEDARGAVGRLEAQIALTADRTVEVQELAAARAQADAAAAQADSARAAIAEQRSRLERFRKEEVRLEELSKQSAAAESALDDARTNAETAVELLKQAEADAARLTAMSKAAMANADAIAARIERKTLELTSLREQLRQARAKLVIAEHELELSYVRSPIDGVVLDRFQIGGGPIAAGTPMMLVGTLDALEVEADVLTQDAYQLQPDAQVRYTVASGSEPLTGKVIRIQPGGFTKYSSLGVEQQRVLVISSLDTRPENLGLGFRLLAQYTKGVKDEALIIPRSAVLQTPEGTLYVFLAEGGRAVRRTVELGLRSDYEVEVTKGLEKGNRVVLTPDSTVQDGSRL